VRVIYQPWEEYVWNITYAVRVDPTGRVVEVQPSFGPFPIDKFWKDFPPRWLDQITEAVRLAVEAHNRSLETP